MKIGHLLTLTFVLLLPAGSALADPVTLNFSGTITDVEATGVTPGITDGTAYTATLYYDPADTSLLGSCGSNSCSYSVNSDLDPFLQVTIGSDVISAFVGESGSSTIEVETNTAEDGGDYLSAYTNGSIDPPEDFGFDPYSTGISSMLSITLNDPTGTAFADDSLPTSLDLSEFATGQLQLQFSGSTNGGLTMESLILTGDVTTSATPEPSGALLGAAGLLLLGCAYRLVRN